MRLPFSARCSPHNPPGAVVLLVVSIPIAIEIVVTTTLALGSKELSLKKVIVTRSPPSTYLNVSHADARDPDPDSQRSR